jgi:hypothetical protein
LLGHVILSIVPAQVAFMNAPVTIEEFAHRVADKDGSSRFSEPMSLAGRLGPIEYLVVEQTFTIGGRNELPRRVYRYFARAGHAMVEVILEFNSGDKRSQEYRALALKTLTSLTSRE